MSVEIIENVNKTLKVVVFIQKQRRKAKFLAAHRCVEKLGFIIKSYIFWTVQTIMASTWQHFTRKRFRTYNLCTRLKP